MFCSFLRVFIRLSPVDNGNMTPHLSLQAMQNTGTSIMFLFCVSSSLQSPAVTPNALLCFLGQFCFSIAFLWNTPSHFYQGDQSLSIRLRGFFPHKAFASLCNSSFHFSVSQSPQATCVFLIIHGLLRCLLSGRRKMCLLFLLSQEESILLTWRRSLREDSSYSVHHKPAVSHDPSGTGTQGFPLQDDAYLSAIRYLGTKINEMTS